MDDYMLTTIDNPFNPYTQFDDWYAFDEQKGYCSCELLARIAKVSDDLEDEDENYTITKAIDDIVELNPLGIYAKFYKNKGVVD